MENRFKIFSSSEQNIIKESLINQLRNTYDTSSKAMCITLLLNEIEKEESKNE